MSRQDNFDIGYQEIEEAVIFSYVDPTNTFEISNFIMEFYMNESITSPHLSGHLSIVDTYNLIDRFPMLGEELLRLKVKDLFGNEFEKVFWLTKIDTIGPNDQLTALAYKLHFMSPSLVYASSRKISRSFYKKNISQIAQMVFEEMFQSPKYPAEIEVEETTGSQSLIIPYMNGIEAMDFLRRRAYSTENKSSNFMFFENRNRHYFKTHEQLIRDTEQNAVTLYHNPNLNVNLDNRLDAMSMIIDISFPIRHGLLNEMKSGAMVHEIVEFDILHKQYIRTIYEYNDLFDDYYHHEKQRALFPHSIVFRQDFFEPENVTKSATILTDPERPNQYYKDMLGHRNSINYYTNTILCQIDINGRYDLNCGDCVYLNIPTFQNLTEREKDENKHVAGLWTIHTINHTVDSENKFKQSILLFKDSYKNG